MIKVSRDFFRGAEGKKWKTVWVNDYVRVSVKLGEFFSDGFWFQPFATLRGLFQIQRD